MLPFGGQLRIGGERRTPAIGPTRRMRQESPQAERDGCATSRCRPRREDRSDPGRSAGFETFRVPREIQPNRRLDRESSDLVIAEAAVQAGRGRRKEIRYVKRNLVYGA